ncbi:MAG TPA: DUF6385 domain-containing protein [Clostridia bacterium]|nr:DUF6385 domain-containing protein [Clostridia bacterium]
MNPFWYISKNMEIQNEYIKAIIQNNFNKTDPFTDFHRCCKALLASRKTESIFEEYETRGTLNYTSWIDNSKFSTYSFFIENKGAEAADVFIQLSPDKISVYNEKTIFTLEPGETKIILPLEYSFFCRLAFKSSGLNRNTMLKIWFQAQV